MKYFVDNVDRYKEAIGDSSYFNIREVPEKNYGVIQYMVNGPDVFPSITEDDDYETQLSKTLLRNCRGLKFRLSDGKILALPHWKFFNVGEREETQPHNIDFTRPHDIVEKLDGSMIHSFIPNDDILWSTKFGESDVAKQANMVIVKNNPQYDRLAKEMAAINHTPIFEYCSPLARIVVEFEYDSLILTEIRNNFTGELFSKEKLLAIGREFHIPVVKFYDTKVINVAEFLSHTKDKEESEGYIIRFEGSEKYKVKTDWYMARHRAFSNVIHEKNIIQAILNEELDDIKAYLSDKIRQDVERFETDLNNHIIGMLTDVRNYCLEDFKNGLTKKQFIEKLFSNDFYNNTLYIRYYDSLLSGDNKDEADIKCLETASKYMIKVSNNKNRLEENRKWFGNLKFSDYVNHFFNFNSE